MSIKNLNLAVAFRAHLMANTDAKALVIDDRSWTRGEIDYLAGKAVSMLLECGIKPGDRVIVQYDTLAEDLAIALAVARVGATIMPVPKRLGVREINYMMDRSNARLFVHQEEAAPSGMIAPAGAAVVGSERIYAYDESHLDGIEAVPEDIALIGVTSGSTGQPKGVMHTWGGVGWSSERMRRLADIQPGEAIAVTGAGAGAPGFTIFSYTGLATGAALVKPKQWNPERVLQLARDHECVWSCMVPTMLEMLLQARERALGSRKLEHIRAVSVGGAVMSPDLIRRARSELGIEVLRMYAMAECMVNASMVLADSTDERDYFDGRPDTERGAQLGIFDDDRKHLNIGEIGEIGLKGPSLLAGYLGDPDGKEKQMTSDGFFLSGDLGKLTTSGLVKVVGRKKDMIIRGGFNIDPSEVEEMIKSHPAILKVVIVGYADKIFGEKACAVVETLPGKSIELEELMSHLVSQGLSKEKIPERLEIMNEIPLSPDGKILKAKVKEIVEGGP